MNSEFKGKPRRSPEKFLLLAFLFAPSLTQAAEPPIGKLGNIIGKAEVLRQGATLPASRGMEIYSTDALQTFPRTAVKIEFTDGGTFMAFENANVKIEEYRIQATGDTVSLKSTINVVKGKVRFFVKPNPDGKNDATIKTPNAVMGIRGTSGFVDASENGKTQIVILTGQVEVTHPAFPGQSVMLNANQMSDVIGRTLPSPPKAAPLALMQNLDAETNRVDPPSAPNSPSLPGPENSEPSAPQEGGNAPSSPQSGSVLTEPEPSPVAVEKKTVYSPSGEPVVSLNEPNLLQITTEQARVSTPPEGSVRSPTQTSETTAPSANQSSALTNTTRAIQRTVNTATTPEPERPRRKPVRVKVVLPPVPK